MADVVAELQRGRDLCARRAWRDAHDALAAADRAAPLGVADLELLALAAYMLNRDDDYVLTLERVHHAHLDAGDPARAARCAFWIGLNLFPRGEAGPAMGWFGRARRLVDQDDLDCVERGYLLIPELLRHVGAGDAVAAHAVASETAEIAARFADPDLFSLAVHEQGHALVRQGRVEEGLRLIDETMVAVTAGELSPIVTGIIYCNTIAFCHRVFELRRARDWTAALTLWCDQQPDMVAFTGRCLVHRAEVMQLRGAWADALEEARRAAERLAAAGNARGAGYAHYRQGELLRLRGEAAAAEEAYRAASLLRVGAAAGARAAAPGAGRRRGRRRGHPARPDRDRRAARAGGAAARLRGDHAGRGRARGGRRGVPGARGDRREPGERRPGGAGRPGARGGRPGRGRRGRRAAGPPARLADLGRPGRAVRGGLRAGAGGPRVPGARRRRGGRVGARGGQGRLRRARRRRRRRARRGAGRAGRRPPTRTA